MKFLLKYLKPFKNRMTVGLSIKIAGAAFGLAFSAILLGYPLIVVIGIMLAIAIIEIFLAAILYSAVKRGRENLVTKEA